jgi:hypothetical protein
MLQHERATDRLTSQMDQSTDGFTCQPIIRYARPILRTGLLHETTRGPHDVGESYCDLLGYNTVQSGLSTDVSEQHTASSLTSTLNMETVCFSETLVTTYHTAWSQNSQGHNMEVYCLKFRTGNL